MKTREETNQKNNMSTIKKQEEIIGNLKKKLLQSNATIASHEQTISQLKKRIEEFVKKEDELKKKAISSFTNYYKQ